ncbi:hypothetical protein [Pseudoalteromonas sp.]|uniref:hypothetical protein n=1 Tax=Pseudoalteromonas sp. TaxID=53249 RepID=UPI0035631B80
MRFARLCLLNKTFNKNVKNLVNTVLATSLVVFAPFSISSASTLILLSDDLTVCSSESQRFCSDEGKKSFSEDVKQKAIFDITDEALVRVSQYPWTEQEELKKQVTDILKAVKPKFENVKLTERQFVRALRGVSTKTGEESVSGRDIWQSLYEFEKRNLFDLLEQKQLESRNNRLKTQVNFAETTNIEASLAYQNLFDLSAEIAGNKRKPRIAVITGTNRDPYAKVDYYLNLFEQVGFEAVWLPLDAAMQTAITAKEYEKTACDSLQDFQIKRLASFRREVLYPDLFQQQVSECKKSEPLIDTIKRMDAIYIADGSPLLSYHAFYTPTGSKSAALDKIVDMYKNNEVLIAVEGGSINAITSDSKPLSILTGVVNEINTTEPISFASGNDACSLGADCIALESEREFTVVESAILPFLPSGIIDTQVSERGKQLRGIHAALFSSNQHLFGLDNKTSVVMQRKGIHTEVEVLGSGGLWLFEITKENNKEGVREFTSHYFTHGDQISLRNGNVSVEFPSWKYATQLNGTQPQVTSAQALARDNFYKLNEMMCKTGAKQALGNDTVNDLDVNISISQNSSALARLGVVKVRGGEFQVCSLSQVANKLTVLPTL